MKSLSNFKQHAGFTLIELLIVIALLGALAVGLLATVDPFEQLKKGTDTSTRNTVSEMYNAYIRYYATRNQFPWISTEQVGVTANSAEMTDDPSGYITQVIDSGELKADFRELAGGALTKILVTSPTSADGISREVAVCFMPESKSFKGEENVKYDASANIRNDCVSDIPGGADGADI